MKNLNLKIHFVIFICSALLPVLTAILTKGIEYNIVLTYISYFYLTFYFLRKHQHLISLRIIVLDVILGRCLPDSDVIYGYFTGETWSLPLFFLTITGIISGYFYCKWKKPVNIFPFILGLLIAVFFLFQGWDYWNHRYNFGTFNGKVESHALPAKFESFDEQKNFITDDNFKNKIVLLDFWTTTCGVCFKKFPQVQTLSEKYKNDSSVVILAVNSPLEEDKPNQAFEMIKEREYDFPVVVTKDESLAENLGVKGYPTTFVMDQKGQVVYKGDIEGAVKMVDELKSNSQ